MGAARFKRSRRPFAKAVVLAVSALLALPIASRAQDNTVTIGIVNSTTDAPILIAQKLGFFKQEGIDAQIQSFDSAAQMIVPLGAGRLDVAAGAPSAALYNAIGRHVEIKIVADKASSAPGYGFQPLLVRKALIAAGSYKSLKDLKGLRVAEGAQGTNAAPMLARALKMGGLQYKDVQHVYLGFPKMLPAFDNGAIDAAVIAEPLATLAERDGSAVRVMGNDAIDPNQEMATIMYGGPFIKQHRDLAQRFMMAYLRAVRFYNDALSDGHLRGRTANDVVAVVAEATHAKDPSVFRQMTANAVDPDGRINVTSLREDLEFFKTQGLINTPKVRVEDAVDPSFAAAAVKTLGEYRPNKG